MKKLFLVSLAFVPVWACAGAESDGSDGSGGVPGSGGSGSGGTFGSGGKASITGGSANSGGTVGSGGAPSSGGTVSSGGNESSGGSGGGSGGDGSGGAPQYEGDCAGKPTLADWQDSSGATGDTVIYRCPLAQSLCTADMVGEDWLFECVATHTNNCRSQDPTGGFDVWEAIDSCENLGFGGMGGMGGGP